MMPGRRPLGVMPSLEGEDAAGGTGMTARLPPAACDVAAKVALLQGFYSMPKPLPAGARPRPASCHEVSSDSMLSSRLKYAVNEICWTIILR